MSLAISELSTAAQRRLVRWGAFREKALQWAVWCLVAIMVLGPVLPIAYASFADRPLYETGIQFGFGNYADLFADADFWAACGNTLAYAVMATIPALVIGTSLAILVSRTDMPLRRFITAAMILPLMFPGLGITLGWVAMYSSSGFISTLFADTFGFVPWDLYSIGGMAFVSLDKTIPLVYFLTRSRLSSLDSSIEDAALSSGAKPWRVLRNVTLPMMRPSVITSAILITMLAFESLGLPLILGTPAEIETLSTYLYNHWTRVSDSQGLVSAAASLLLLGVTLAFVARSIVDRGQARFVTVTGKPRPQRPLMLGPARWLFMAFCLGYLTLAVIIPVIGLLGTAFTSIFTPLISPFELLTLQNFQTVFNASAFSRSIVNSLIIATIGAAIAVAVIAMGALVAHRSRFRLRGTLPPLMLYPRAMPGIVVGVGFFWAFILIAPLSPLRTTIWGIMIAFIVRNLAVGYAAIQPTMQSLGSELDAAARSCGASWWHSARTITLPLIKPALFGSYVLMFVYLLNDYDPAVFLTTSGNEVIGVTMLQQWFLGFPGPVAALGFIQMLVTVVVLGVGRLLFGVKPNA